MSEADDRDDKNDKPEEYKIGYRRPPVEHQFKKGHPGPRRGRKQGSRNRKTILLDAVNRPNWVTIDGRRKRMTNYDLSVNQQVKKARDGDTKAFLVVNDMMREVGIFEAEATAALAHLAPEDELVMADIIDRIRASDPEPAETSGDSRDDAPANDDKSNRTENDK